MIGLMDRLVPAGALSWGRLTLADMRRPWCQQAWPAVQYRSPVMPCGSRMLLRTETRYGVLYNFCPIHRISSEGGEC